MLWSKTKCGKVKRRFPTGFLTFSGSMDCENRRRHDQQHLEAWSSCWSFEIPEVTRQSSGWGFHHKLLSGTQSLARPRRSGWSGLKVAEGLINGWSLHSGRKWRAEEIFCVQVIPFDEWPDEFFPTNCWGVVYIMSQFVRNKLIQVKIWICYNRVVKIAGW